MSPTAYEGDKAEEAKGPAREGLEGQWEDGQSGESAATHFPCDAVVVCSDWALRATKRLQRELRKQGRLHIYSEHYLEALEHLSKGNERFLLLFKLKTAAN